MSCTPGYDHMNTPSKEALEASEAVQDYLGFPRRATMDIAAIIDRHFEPLRQRANQADARVNELEVNAHGVSFGSAELCAHVDDIRALRASVADWKRCADFAERALASEQQRNAELAEALRSAVNELERQTTYSDGMPSVSHNLKYNLRAVLARHAAGEPAKPMMRDDPRYKGTSYGEAVKHPDTERLDWLSDEWAVGNVLLPHSAAISQCQTLRGAIDAARRT